MPGIAVGNNESIDSALRRFKKQVGKGVCCLKLGNADIMRSPVREKKSGLTLQRNACRKRSEGLNQVGFKPFVHG
jgi:ribosomal protein S21